MPGVRRVVSGVVGRDGVVVGRAGDAPGAVDGAVLGDVVIGVVGLADGGVVPGFVVVDGLLGVGRCGAVAPAAALVSTLAPSVSLTECPVIWRCGTIR